MQDYVTFLIIAVVLISVFGRMLFGQFAAKKRRAAIEEVANQLGLSWFPDGNGSLSTRYSGFSLLSQGRGRKIQNLIEGVTDEVRISIFDYQFTTGSGKNERTTRQSVTSLSSNQLNCPEFSMRPEGILDRVGGVLGLQDIDFDSHPLFSKSFVLKGPDEEAIRLFFKPAVLEFFELHAGVSAEGQGQTMCFYRAGKFVRPDQIKELLGDAYRVFGAVVDT